MRNLLYIAIITWIGSILHAQEDLSLTVSMCNSESNYVFQSHPAPNFPVRVSVELDLNSDGTLLAVARSDEITLYDLIEETDTKIALAFDNAWQITLAWSPLDDRLAYVPYIFRAEGIDPHSRVYIWDAAAGSQSAVSVPVRLRDLDWSPSGDALVLGHLFGPISVWNTLQETELVEITNQSRFLSDAIVWIDETTIITAQDRNAPLRTWSLEDASFEEIDAPIPQAIIAWNTERVLLAAVQSFSKPYVLDVATETVKMQVDIFEQDISIGNIASVAWSRDGNLLAIGGSRGFIQVDIRSEEVVAYNAPNMPEFMRITWLDNERIVSVSRAGTVFIWNIPDNCLERIIEEQRIVP